MQEYIILGTLGTCKSTSDMCCKSCKKTVAYDIYKHYTHTILLLRVSLIVLIVLCSILLLGGDIETNPGPLTRKCPQCFESIHIRKTICDYCSFH